MRLHIFFTTAACLCFYFACHAVSANPLKKINTDEPIRIEADMLEISRDDAIAVFSGNVSAVQGTLSIKGAVMRVYYNEAKNNDKDQAIKKIDISGKVRVYSGEDKATGDHAVYDADAGTVTMKGKNLILTSGYNTLKGSELVYDINSGESRLKGGTSRVSGTFIPNKE